MRSSGLNYVRAKTLLSSLFGRSKSVKEAYRLTEQEQEKLKRILPTVRIDQPRSGTQVDAETYDADEILDYRIDADSIRARGFLKYRYNYEPPSGVKDTVLSVAKDHVLKKGEEVSNLPQCRLEDNDVKMKVILSLAERFKHCPTNSRLMHLKTVQDLIDFYEEPVANVTNYTKLSRMESKPTNVYMMEQASRFHPEDIEAWHGGVTAFPGTGGTVFGLRNKRLLRQFKPKAEWFDYEDQTFDYTPPEKDMPWDNEIARRMDRYPDKRFDIKRRQFIRTK
ncbi:Mitochondrial Ribosomal Protein Large [Trichostrongylus colubriformis]|uniref:Large ribosomal subunit protein mL50 n=1 Tax=Trichostrongylus colubriformis TaxID=6319 RepID=A0AAN8IAT9_TRICO